MGNLPGPDPVQAHHSDPPHLTHHNLCGKAPDAARTAHSLMRISVITTLMPAAPSLPILTNDQFGQCRAGCLPP